MAVVGKRIEERRECIKSKCERHLPALRAIATTDDKKTIEDKLALYQIRSDDYFTRRGLQKACDFK